MVLFKVMQHEQACKGRGWQRWSAKGGELTGNAHGLRLQAAKEAREREPRGREGGKGWGEGIQRTRRAHVVMEKVGGVEAEEVS